MKLCHYIFRMLCFNAFLLVVGISLHAQDANNYLSVASSLKNFNINSVSAVETEQVQSNAFSITLKSRNVSFSVYASIPFYSSSNGYVLPAGVLSIRLKTVAPSRTANFNEIPLSGSNQLIIQSTKTNNQTVVYTYDMNFGPVGFETPPGTYNATIMFTMTQP